MSDDLTEWLLWEGRFEERLAALFEGFCRVAVATSIPIWRAAYVAQTLHPLERASVLHWHEDRAAVEVIKTEYGSEQAKLWLDSPIRVIFLGGSEIRRCLERPDCKRDFPILEDLIEQGVSDYIVLPILQSNRKPHAITFATKITGGFSEAHLDRLRQSCRILAPLLELREARTLASTLMDTYLGHHTGGRVLDGAITRGSGETIDAVIWFCDLRGFTDLSNELQRDELIHLLNDYFGEVGRAVEEGGGEILKFVGDAMLAIFPLLPESDVGAVCREALDSASRAQANISNKNVVRSSEGRPPIKFGISLHLGDVLYGNIGTPSRLDFTVIGPGVNLASRLQHIAADLDLPLVFSGEFAEHVVAKTRDLGTFSLKGFEHPVNVFCEEPQPRPD